MCQDAACVTKLLRQGFSGDRGARELAMSAVYEDLLRYARRVMRGQPRNHTLEATGLLHEAYLKLSGTIEPAWRSRGHFLAAMARTMRHVLIDHAKSKRRAKRGGDRSRVPLTDIAVRFEDRLVDLLTLDETLVRLEAIDADAARIVDLQFFVGLTSAETAAALEMSQRTVERHWTYARAWMLAELSR